MSELRTDVIFFGSPVTIICDGKCEEAFGINWRGEKTIPAPDDPGTYEGGHGKPARPYPPDRHNKWCARECERSRIARDMKP